jgi:hypothetical protein
MKFTIAILLSTFWIVCNAQYEPYTLQVNYDSKVYLLFYKTFANYNQASVICKEHGGEIVTIMGKEVQNQVFMKMKMLIGTYFHGSENVTFNETWSYWISKYQYSYSNWYVDVLGGVAVNSYQYYRQCPEVLLGTDAGYWRIIPCAKEQPFVCEQPREITQLHVGNKAYKVYAELKTRQEAFNLCKFNNGHLPFIRNSEENDKINTHVSNYLNDYVCVDNRCPNGMFLSFWIGAKNASTDLLQWSFDDGSNMTFTHWADNEPIPYWDYESWRVNNQFNCIVSFPSSTNVWRTSQCNLKSYVVCEVQELPIDVFNMTHIGEWLNKTELFNNGSISIIHNNYTQYYENITHNYTNVNNMTTILYNNIQNVNTTVYDRKMNIGRITPEHVLWTVVAIGGFLVLVVFIVTCVCISCWCYYR